MRKSAISATSLKLAVVAFTAVVAFFGFYAAFNRSFSAKANSSGPPTTNSGAPGEQNCSSCHSDFAVNTGGGAVSINGLPPNYTPGASYPVTVTVNQTNAVIFGFQSSSLDRQNLQAGNFTLPAQSPQQLQILNGIVDGNQRRYVEHTINGTAPPAGVFETKSWTFNWIAPATRRGKVTLYAAGNGANSDGGTGGDYIYTANASVCSGAVQANFDGDGKADLSLFRPSDGVWYRLNSRDNSFAAAQFGSNGDKVVPGDFDGDDKNDLAVWRPSNGAWYILRSSNNSVAIAQFGLSNDIPLVGDYTGDGKSELAVWRPSTGVFYTFDLTNNNFAAAQWGQNGDKPIAGDFDGDGKTDFAVWRPSNAAWYVYRSSNGSALIAQFGANGDTPLSGDFDGDGKNDLAVWRNSNAAWYWTNSGSNNSVSSAQYGSPGDIPVPTDYDGDCKTDLAVYRNGAWYIYNSSTNTTSGYNFGLNGDVPAATAFTAQ